MIRDQSPWFYYHLLPPSGTFVTGLARDLGQETEPIERFLVPRGRPRNLGREGSEEEGKTAEKESKKARE